MQAPLSGAYLGAYAQPSYAPHTATWGQEEQEMEGLESDVGRTLALHNEYRTWSALADFASSPPSPDPNMTQDVADGRIPVIALQCQDDMTLNQSGHALNLLDIIDGKADADLAKVAKGLSTLQISNNGGPYPVMLRYFWEFNVNAADGRTENGNDCYVPPGTVEASPASPDPTAPPYNLQFIQAWQHIHTVLNFDATPQNITWVWNPAVVNLADGNGDPTVPVGFDDFWPGSAYVDWISGDGYSEWPINYQNPVTFRGVFDGFMQDIQNESGPIQQYYGKPLMITETGACKTYAYPYDQAGYLAAAESTLETPPLNVPEYGDVHAFMYFDAQGNYTYGSPAKKCDWSLDGQAYAPDPTGMAQFNTIAHDTYFTQMATP